MKLTKNQLTTIVSTICNNEYQRLQKDIDQNRKSPEIQKMVAIAQGELNTISDSTWRIMNGYSCSGRQMPSKSTLEEGAMYHLGYQIRPELPRGFKEQIELKVQMCFIDAKNLEDLEKKVGYSFIVI